MANFIVKITNYEWGTREFERRVECSDPGIAANRAYKQAKKAKAFGKHRLSEFNFKVTKI